jgi:hypothetical protein
MHALALSRGRAVALTTAPGGAPAFRRGKGHIFSNSLGGQALMAIWYHFAIMFEALFILHRSRDAGTRVGRFMIQEGPGARVGSPLGRTSWYPSILVTSALIVAGWGYLSVAGRQGPARRNQLAMAAGLASPTNYWPPSRCAWPPPSSIKMGISTLCRGDAGSAGYGWFAVTFTAVMAQGF